MNENKLARRVEDKRADTGVDWTDAPRFTALGIAETWSVTVEAEGQCVLCISEQHVAGLDGERLEQFAPTIRSCAQHLLGFIGAVPAPRTTGPAKGGFSIAYGWKLVLTRPTDEMRDAGNVLILDRGKLFAAYRAMLDAAPNPPVSAAEQPLYDDNGLPWNEAAEREAARAVEKPAGDLPPPDVIDTIAIEAGRAAGGAFVDIPLTSLAKFTRAAIAAHLARQAQAAPVAVVDEGDNGLFIDIIYGRNGSPLKCGDKLYLAPVAPAGAQNAEAIRNQAWQSIDTAPKDGTEVLLFLGQPWSRVAKACWFAPWSNWQEGELPDVDQDEYCGIGSALPTHWMPLPEAPALQTGSANTQEGGDRG